MCRCIIAGFNVVDHDACTGRVVDHAVEEDKWYLLLQEDIEMVDGLCVVGERDE